MSKRTIFAFLLLSLIINLSDVKSQTADLLSARQPVYHFALDSWNTADGLPSNNINDIFQDSEGFLWISAFNGLVKFDGINFEIFDKTNIDGLLSNAVYKGFQRNNGVIYFATQGSGILELKDGKFNIYGKETGVFENIRNVFVSSKGEIYAGSNNHGLYLKRDSAFVLVDISEKLKKSTINQIAESPNGEIYVATANDGLFILSDNGYREVLEADGLPSNVVKTITFSGDDVYIGTNEGISRLRDHTILNFEQLKGYEINDADFGPDGKLWLATEMGLARYDFSNNWDIFTEDEGLPSRQLSSLCFDTEGNLWISSKKSGILRFKYSNFTSITTSDGLSLDRINVLCETAPGVFLIGSDNGDIDLIKNNKIFKIDTRLNLDNFSIKDIIIDRNEVIWMATYKGIIKWRMDRSEQDYSKEEGLPDNFARVIHEDRKGNIWVGYKNSGLIRLNEDMTFVSFNRENGLGSDYVLSINETSDGTIVVGTHSGGLNFIKNDKIVDIKYPINDGTGVLLFNIYIDEDEYMWIATNIGLFRYKDGSFLSLSQKDGLGTETIFDIKEDNQGYLWISSNEGLVRIEKQQVLDFFEGKITGVKSMVFDDNDGMVSKECTAASKMLFTSSGELWVPTMEGIAVVETDRIIKNEIIPKVHVSQINLDDELFIDNSTETNSGINIDPGHKRYKINYTGISLTAPPKVRFRYILEGFDKEWIENVKQREAVYTNLRPGKYTFKVMASNNDGLWNPKEASLSFRVKPFFYQTPWFYLAIFLLISSVIYWRIRIIKIHNGKLQKLNKELDRFVYSTSHDLRAPLMSVLGLVNIAKIDKDPENVNEYLNSIEGSVKKLDRFIGDIIDYSRNSRIEVQAEKISLKEFIDSIFNSLTYLDPENRIEKRINIDKNASEVITDERRLGIVLSNIVSNSYRYHRPLIDDPYIEVNISPNSQGIVVAISDNGQGIKKEYQDKIFDMFYRASETNSGSGLGLYIVKETMEKLGGEIQVSSQWNAGSTFTLHIPTIRK